MITKGYTLNYGLLPSSLNPCCNPVGEDSDWPGWHLFSKLQPVGSNTKLEWRKGSYGNEWIGWIGLKRLGTK